MTIQVLKTKLKELTEKGVSTERDVTQLYTERQNLNELMKICLRDIEFKERKIQEIKSQAFRIQMELNVKVNKEKQEQRKEQIALAKKDKPSYDHWIEKELQNVVKEIEDIGFTVEETSDYGSLLDSYKKLKNEKMPTRERAILTESELTYDNLLTSLIEKELDGGKVDLMEQRNLKTPILNFLSNPYIKTALRI